MTQFIATLEDNADTSGIMEAISLMRGVVQVAEHELSHGNPPD